MTPSSRGTALFPFVSLLLLTATLVLAPSAALAQLTRSEAVAVLEREVPLAPDTPVWSPFVDFGAGAGFEGLLPPGSTLTTAFENHPLLAPAGLIPAGDAYVFLIDDDPLAQWSHWVRFAVIDANQPFATATAAVSDQSWWLEVDTGGGPIEYFVERRSDAPAGPGNPDGLVRGIAETVTPMPKAPAVVGKAPAQFTGDPCALLWTGTDDNTFNDDLDRFAGQLAARGMPAGRIKSKKNGKLSDLTALVTAICNIQPECDKIYVFLGGHGLPNEIYGQGANDAEKKITEAELKAALAPLAQKNAKLCVVIQACHSGSLIDGLSDTLKGATIYTSTDDCTVGWGGGFYDKPVSAGGRSYLGKRSVFSGAFSDCWDNDDADKNEPKNGVSWEEAWEWVCDQDPAVYWENQAYKPKDPGAMRGGPQVKGSVWVNSWTCEPGETVTIRVHGTVMPAGGPATITVQNGRTGLKANTPVGGTDNSDLDNLDTNPRPVTLMGNGMFWEDVTVTCPPDANPGDGAIYKVVLKVGGHTVDVDYGCVNVVAASPSDMRQTRVNPMPASSETIPGGSAPVQYEITNIGFQPKQFVVEMNAFNHYDSSVAVLFHDQGLQFVELDGAPTLTGITPQLLPGQTLILAATALTEPTATPLSGFTVDLALFDLNSPDAVNASATVLLVEDPTPISPVPDVVQLYPNRPNPFNPRTEILFRLENDGPTTLAIYDLSGRHVRTLIHRRLEAGLHSRFWDGIDRDGRRVASGTYVYRLVTPRGSRHRSMVLIK